MNWPPPCTNCDDKRCMGCALTVPHEVCAEDCPGCCNHPLFVDECIQPDEEEMYER